MNLRHAVALALVGWYLMVPPFHMEGERHVLDSGTPLSTVSTAGESISLPPTRLFNRLTSWQVTRQIAVRIKRIDIHAILRSEEFREADHIVWINGLEARD
jgi:hypothetical protein